MSNLRCLNNGTKTLSQPTRAVKYMNNKQGEKLGFTSAELQSIAKLPRSERSEIIKEMLICVKQVESLSASGLFSKPSRVLGDFQKDSRMVTRSTFRLN